MDITQYRIPHIMQPLKISYHGRVFENLLTQTINKLTLLCNTETKRTMTDAWSPCKSAIILFRNPVTNNNSQLLNQVANKDKHKH